jgi:GT2 family glycosyltransferase
MPSLPVTIAMVPRETFSDSIASLESFYANTPMPCEMIYVDGNSPEPVCSAIKRWQSEKQFQLIRFDDFLNPNHARNIAWQRAKSKYVVFYDNNLLVTPGWLERLVECAEETGAWIVTPLYLQGDLNEQTIHTAGGLSRFACINGQRGFTEEHRYNNRKLDEVRPYLRREPTELVEFHCVLIRRELFELTGPLDEKLMSMGDHIDLSLAARELGKPVYTEPASVVCYPKPSLAPYDLPYFKLRWSDEWTETSLERLRRKWHLPPDDLFIMSQYGFVRHHRESVLAASGIDSSKSLPLDQASDVSPQLTGLTTS